MQNNDMIEKNGKIVVWMTQAKINEQMEMIGEKIADMAGEKQAMSAMLIFEELFVNIANYAYDDKEDKPVIIKCIKMEDKPVQISFIDSGFPFDPTSYDCGKTDSEQVGGHGIRLIKKLSSVFEYHRQNNQNIVNVFLAE